mgnify:CR=1 FL=1
MFLADSEKKISDIRFEADSKISILNLVEKICEGEERLLFKFIDEQKTLRPHVNIFVGTRNCRKLNGLDTYVSAGDEVSVFPSLSGG